MAGTSDAGDAAPFTVGIVLYADCDLLDVAGPNEVYTFFGLFYGDLIGRSVRVVTVAQAKPPATVDVGGLPVTAKYGFDNCPQLDLMFVPGGGPSGMHDSIGNQVLLDFLTKQAAKAQYVASVCTGGLLLASAGLLDGYRATAHWAVIDCLRLFPKVTVPTDYPRWLEDDQRAAGRGIRVTGGGISSTIDEALYMVYRIIKDATGDEQQAIDASRGVQLTIQYNPQPPFPPGGDPASVDPKVLEAVKADQQGFHDIVCAAVRRRLGA